MRKKRYNRCDIIVIFVFLSLASCLLYLVQCQHNFSASGPRNPSILCSAFSAVRPPFPPLPSVYLPWTLPLRHPFCYPLYLPSLYLSSSSPLLLHLTLSLNFTLILSFYLFLPFFLSLHRYSLPSVLILFLRYPPPSPNTVTILSCPTPSSSLGLPPPVPVHLPLASSFPSPSP